MREKKWYKLDNVGKFYSSLAGNSFQNIFRFSATLEEEIEKDILQQAIINTIEVFPNFNVNLKRGVFWYYLEETNKKYCVDIENLPICFRLYNNNDDFLFRVSYYKKRINFEVSHIITDGRGSIDFFKLLVSNYVKLKYHLINIDLTTHASYLEKSEDSFSKYYKKTKRWNITKNKIFFYKAKHLKNRTRFMECHMSVSKIVEFAHEYGATLTEFLVAVLIYSCRDVMSEVDLKKVIKIDIPVDLRNYFKSTSSKNFFGLTSVTYQFKSRNDLLEDIMKEIQQQFKQKLTKEKLSERVNRMVAFEKNPFCRVAPLIIKDLILKIIDQSISKASTSCLSNIGKITLLEEISQHVKNINILTNTEGFQFTICSYLDDLSIGISSKYQYNEIIKNFCRFFSDNEIEIIVNASEVD